MYLDYTPAEEQKSSQQPGKLSPEEIARILASVQETTASLDQTIEGTAAIKTVVNRHVPQAPQIAKKHEQYNKRMTAYTNSLLDKATGL